MKFPARMQNGEARSCDMRWLWRNYRRAERMMRRRMAQPGCDPRHPGLWLLASYVERLRGHVTRRMVLNG